MSLSLKEENEHTHGMKYGVLPIYLYIYISVNTGKTMAPTKHSCTFVASALFRLLTRFSAHTDIQQNAANFWPH